MKSLKKSSVVALVAALIMVSASSCGEKPVENKDVSSDSVVEENNIVDDETTTETEAVTEVESPDETEAPAAVTTAETEAAPASSGATLTIDQYDTLVKDILNCSSADEAEAKIKASFPVGDAEITQYEETDYMNPYVSKRYILNGTKYFLLQDADIDGFLGDAWTALYNDPTQDESLRDCWTNRLNKEGWTGSLIDPVATIYAVQFDYSEKNNEVLGFSVFTEKDIAVDHDDRSSEVTNAYSTYFTDPYLTNKYGELRYDSDIRANIWTSTDGFEVRHAGYKDTTDFGKKAGTEFCAYYPEKANSILK